VSSKTLGMFGASCLLAIALTAGWGQERPYFVTYSHDLSESGEMEVEGRTAVAEPENGNPFLAVATEVEYGVRDWWTAGLYLDGQSTDEESTLLTGFRFENRFRPLAQEHAINPVLYVEYGRISDADKTILEIVGHDNEAHLAAPNGVSHKTHQHEAEFRLILSSNFHAWNIAENLIFEKGLGHAPWEFGYSVGATRPLRPNSARSCRFCADKLAVGAETYGGLGDTSRLTLANTSHYVAPLLGWAFANRSWLSFSPGFGTTGGSLDMVFRLKIAHEFDHFGGWFSGHD
jgi:hypothetical protein